MVSKIMLAILIPTYKREYRIKQLFENIQNTTILPFTVYFIVEPDDVASMAAVADLKTPRAIFIHNEDPHTYVSAINTGYKKTFEPIIYCGADDIVFYDGWDTNAQKYFDKYGFVGTVDAWRISQTKLHASHFFVTRKYINEQSGVEDEPGVIYSSHYHHLQCDIETEQTAMKRKQFVISSRSRVEHNHWFVGSAKKDATYERAMECQLHDMNIYEGRRKRFEQYLFERLFHGQIIKTRPGKLSIVLPSYNQLSFLKQTIDSLKENTHNPYQLIIVDDVSDPETTEWIKRLVHQDCIKIFNDKQQFITYNWNLGAQQATGDYIAFLNNDITLSKFWDVYLMNALQGDVWVANPYQRDYGCMTPYGKSLRTGSIDIRGSAFMMKKETIKKMGYFPPQLRHWYSDWWLGWAIITQYKKTTAWVPEALIHHYGSQSSNEFDRRTGRLREIIEADRKEFQKITGLNGYLPTA